MPRGDGGLWRGDGDDGAEVDAWRFVGYGRGGIWKRNVPRWFDEGENVGLSGLGVNPWDLGGRSWGSLRSGKCGF